MHARDPKIQSSFCYPFHAVPRLPVFRVKQVVHHSTHVLQRDKRKGTNHNYYFQVNKSTAIIPLKSLVV